MVQVVIAQFGIEVLSLYFHCSNNRTSLVSCGEFSKGGEGGSGLEQAVYKLDCWQFNRHTNQFQLSLCPWTRHLIKHLIKLSKLKN